MSSTNTKSTDKNFQGKAELHTSHDSDTLRDKNAAGSSDYVYQGGAEGVDKNFQSEKDKNKNEKTTITFEKKKEKVKDEDKDMKDLSAKKDVSSKHESSGEGKGIINTIKEKVMDVLGSGDNDKEKDKNKDWEKEKNKDWEKDTKNKDKFVSSEHDKNVGISSGTYSSNLGASSGQQHSADLGSSHISSDKYGSSSIGSDKYASSGIGSDKYASSGQYSAGVGVSGSADKYSSNLGSSSSDKHSNLASSNLASTSASSDKYAAHSGSAGAGYQGATIDRSGLGAEHKELGYDKHSNVIPSKNVDKVDKEKDSGHKLDIHASVKTGSAAGSTSGSQASTYKTTESK